MRIRFNRKVIFCCSDSVIVTLYIRKKSLIKMIFDKDTLLQIKLALHVVSMSLCKQHVPNNVQQMIENRLYENIR